MGKRPTNTDATPKGPKVDDDPNRKPASPATIKQGPKKPDVVIVDLSEQEVVECYKQAGKKWAEAEGLKDQAAKLNRIRREVLKDHALLNRRATFFIDQACCRFAFPLSGDGEPMPFRASYGARTRLTHPPTGRHETSRHAAAGRGEEPATLFDSDLNLARKAAGMDRPEFGFATLQPQAWWFGGFNSRPRAPMQGKPTRALPRQSPFLPNLYRKDD